MGKKANLKKNSKLKQKKGLLYIQHNADPLFSSISHPTEPIIVTGSATGRVQSYKYNKDELREVRKDFDGLPYIISTLQKDDFLDDTVDLLWSTKRHKGSCRGLCFDLQSEGKKMYSIGSEGVIKMSDLETGKVISKYINEELKYTKCIAPPGKPYLVVGDEIGNVYCHDNREKNLKWAYEPIRRLHNGEGINGIQYCWPKSEYKFITMGSTTVCEIDLRKPENPVRESEDQEDEVICGAFVDQEKQDTMVCGMGEGVVTIWKPELNKWEDQVNRIKVSKEESIDAIISCMDSQGRYVWAGSSDGSINKIDVVDGRCVEYLLNRDPENTNLVDEVTILDLDHEYKLVSGGMDGLTIWDDDNDSSDEEDNDDSDDLSSDSDNENESDPDASSPNSANANAESDSEANSDSEAAPDVDSEQDEESNVETKKSMRESLKRRFAGLQESSKKAKIEVTEEKEVILEVSQSDSDSDSDSNVDVDADLEEVPDSDDDNEDIGKAESKTVPLGEIRDQILSEITEAYKSEDQPVKLSKKQRKKMKILKGPGPEHGIAKFDDL